MISEFMLSNKEITAKTLPLPKTRVLLLTMIVCIAEKPSVARDIAEVLGAKTEKKDILRGMGIK